MNSIHRQMLSQIHQTLDEVSLEPKSLEGVPMDTITPSMMVSDIGVNMWSLRIKRFVRQSPLFKYVTDKKSAIDALIKVASQPGFEEGLRDLILTLNSRPMNWDNINLRDENVLHMVTLAFIDGGISDAQLATVFIKAAAIERFHSKEAMSVLDGGGPSYLHLPLFLADGSINPVARDLLMQTQARDQNPLRSADMLYYEYLNPEQMDQWFELMRTLPASEQYLLIGKEYRKGFDNLERAMEGFNALAFIARRFTLPPLLQPEIMDSTNLEGVHNVFHRATNRNGIVPEFAPGQVIRIVPSAGMIDAAIQVRGGDQVREFHFGAGSSAWEGDRRVVSLPSPYATIPYRADTYLALFEAFALHDLLYHIPKVAIIPKAHRDLHLAYANELEWQLQWYSSDAAVHGEMITLINRIRDMEIISYEPAGISAQNAVGFLPTPNTRFWHAMSNTLTATKSRHIVEKMARQEHLSIPEMEELAKKLLSSHRKLANSVFEEINEAALRTLFIQQPALAEAADVSLEGLINFAGRIIAFSDTPIKDLERLGKKVLGEAGRKIPYVSLFRFF